MAATVWMGRITFGLVSIPVRLFTAVQSHDIAFHYLHEKDNSRVKMQYVCKAEDKAVERSELVKGYEYEKNRYVIVDPEELEKLEPQSSSNLDIERFVSLDQVDPIYFEKSYYLGPAEEGTEKPFALLAKAMEKRQKAAIGKLLMRDREYLALIRPARGGLVLQTMHYDDEIRKNENKIKLKEVNEKQLELAEQIIENLGDEFDPAEYSNDYINRVQEFLDAKIEGRKVKIPRERPKKTIPDLLEALQKSVEQSKKRPAARAGDGQPPIDNYDELSVKEILQQAENLSEKELEKLKDYERSHKKRKTLIRELRKIA